MKRYSLFALDSFDRIDRGFEKTFHNDDDAFGFAATIPDASSVEVRCDKRLIASIRFHNGKSVIVAAC